MMDIEANKALVRRYLDLWSASDPRLDASRKKFWLRILETIPILLGR